MKGDCYIAAFNLARELQAEGEPGVKLCHGTVTTPQGTFGHAWVELRSEWVLDHSQGLEVAMERDRYYDVLKVWGVVEYTPDQALGRVLKHGHDGPWDDERKGRTIR